MTLKSLRDNIGIVQQDVYLFSGTIQENIGYGRPGASREDVIKAAKRAGAHDFIMGLTDGYDTDVGQRRNCPVDKSSVLVSPEYF